MTKNTISITAKDGGAVKLDELDLRILDALYQDGRITKKNLSEKIGLSATRCWERMQKMEKSGVIEGYHTDLDLKRLFGVSLFFTQLKVRNYTFTRQQRIEEILNSMNEVLSCYSVMGEVDYFLIVMARDIEHYQQVIESIRANRDLDLEYTTFPVTNFTKKPYTVSFAELAERAKLAK